MKVLLINGSPRKNGNTYIALQEVAKTLEINGVQAEIISIGTKAVQGCIGCLQCREHLGRCVFQDDLYNSVLEQVKQVDGIIIGSPTYYAGPNGSLCALLDRVFFSLANELIYKPGSAVAVCRRGGASANLDRLNKYFSVSNMPIVTSQYWNIIHGFSPGEVLLDPEGLQTMRTLGHNMSRLLKAIHNDKSVMPTPEPKERTNFIR